MKPVPGTVSTVPTILAIDNASLLIQDREAIAARIRRLAPGSAVLHFTRANEDDVLGALARQRPDVQFKRIAYVKDLPQETIKAELTKLMRQTGIEEEHTGLLIAKTAVNKGQGWKAEGGSNRHSEELQRSDEESQRSFASLRMTSDFGFVMQFDPEHVSERIGFIPGLSGAVLGELMDVVALKEEVREVALRKAKALGILSSVGNIYSLVMDLWLDARSEQRLAASA